jgi:hypothetical protein
VSDDIEPAVGDARMPVSSGLVQRRAEHHPSEVGIADVEPIVRGAAQGTCPWPMELRMARSTLDDLCLAAAALDGPSTFLALHAHGSAPVLLDEDVPEGRVRIAWPDIEARMARAFAATWWKLDPPPSAAGFTDWTS